MLESLPETVQDQVVEHLRKYLADLQDELAWDDLFKRTQPQLVAAARRAKEEIAKGQAKPMDFDQRKDGRTFALTPEQTRRSPLDVPSIRATVRTEELVDIRASCESVILAFLCHSCESRNPVKSRASGLRPPPE